MNINFYQIYHSIGINKRAVCFLIAGVIIIFAAKTYAKRHFLILSENHIIKFKAANSTLRRYAVRGAPTYDELITRAQHFDEYYINEAKKIVDTVSLPEIEHDFVIPSDERFAHIVYKQRVDRFKNNLSEKLPGVNVYGKFFEIRPINTPVQELNKHLRRMWLLNVFLEKLQGCGFDNSHFVSVVMGDPDMSVLLRDLNVFGNVDVAIIDARFRLTLDELLNIFGAFRKSKGYFFVEDVQIGTPEGQYAADKERLDVSFKLLYLDLSVRDSINYAPVTPAWRLNSDD